MSFQINQLEISEQVNIWAVQSQLSNECKIKIPIYTHFVKHEFAHITENDWIIYIKLKE